MGKRKVNILEPAAEAIAEVAHFIEAKGLPQTAKKFVDEVFEFLGNLADERILHKQCNYNNVWKYLNYRCVTYKKYGNYSPLSNHHFIAFFENRIVIHIRQYELALQAS